MLTRFDPFRAMNWGFDRAWTAMPMDAVRREDAVVVELDLPGVDPESIDVTVERNVLMITAERPLRREQDVQVISAERPSGRFSRQLFLGQGLETDRIEASYDGGVLTVTVPVAETARPHRISISHGDGAQAISAGTS